jgi:hypothetical protein
MINLPDAVGESSLQPGVFSLFVYIRVRPLMEKVDGMDLGLEHFFRTAEAGAHSGVNNGSSDRYAEPCGRQQSVLFCVNTYAQVVASTRRVLVSVCASTGPERGWSR